MPLPALVCGLRHGWASTVWLSSQVAAAMSTSWLNMERVSCYGLQEEWEEEFAQYKLTPEYIKTNQVGP